MSKRVADVGNCSSKRVKFSTARNAGKLYEEDSSVFENPADFEDAVLESLERDRRAKQRQKGFKMDGYGEGESDSDDSDSDSRKQKVPADEQLGQVDEEEEEDMFGEDTLKPKRKSIEPKPKTLTEEAMSAQEENPDDEFAEYQAAEEDETGTRVKKHIPIEPFNLKEEMQEGSFDQEGVYHERKDENRHHDSWMQGISAKEIKKAAEAYKRRELLAKEKEMEEAKKAGLKTKTELLQELLKHLQPGENAIKLIQRLGAKTSRTSKRKQQKEAMDIETTEKAKENRQIIEKVTEIADKLMQLGHLTAYEETYEQIKRALYRDEESDQEDIFSELPSENQPFWQYKLHQEGELFGPFSSKDMLSWTHQGYFHTSVLCRPVRKNDDGSVLPIRNDFQMLSETLFK